MIIWKVFFFFLKYFTVEHEKIWILHLTTHSILTNKHCGYWKSWKAYILGIKYCLSFKLNIKSILEQFRLDLDAFMNKIAISYTKHVQEISMNRNLRF